MKYDPSTPLADCGLSAPAIRALNGAGYFTLKDVANVKDAQLASLHGFGPNGQRKLHQALAEAGLGEPQDTNPQDPAPQDTF